MGYIEELRAVIGHRAVNLNGSIVIIEDKQGRILLQKRTYPVGKWGLPGGLMELGESTEDTARREVFEETGLSVGKLTLVGIYSGKDCLCVAENGDRFYVVTTAYATSDYSGTCSVHDEESVLLEWTDRTSLPETIAKTHAAAIADYLRLLKP